MRKFALLLLLFNWCISACSQPETASKERQLNYPLEKEKALALQKDLAARYREADSSGKERILQESKQKLFALISHDLIPGWYGTKWDFNGTTETPGQGTIACGYFVTTVLRDAGFQLNRYKYAQMASEAMILKLTPKVKRFSGADFNTVEKYIAQTSYGIFIAGLDNHTGFIIKTKDSIRFVHSVAYEDVDGVVSQDLPEATIFNLSNYKVLGEILHEDMIRAWLEGGKYE
ncbi:MAG: hypothetical protein K0R65_2392 [Crocinitomicaceae bacterium]|jgi:hypothetical protein|nr:hypothetical protein [Crocinitomicaceae bacterium]